MWFKNLVLFKVVSNVGVNPFEFEQALEKHPLIDPSPIDHSSRGWVDTNNRMLVSVGGNFLFTLGVAERQLPPAVIKQELKKREKALANEQGYDVGKRQRRELKQKITDELLAKSMIKTRTTAAWLDMVNGLLAVDTSSHARADELVSLLGETYPNLQVLPLETAITPDAAIQNWACVGAPGQFTGEDFLELTGQNGANVKYKNSDIQAPEVTAQLTTMLVAQVGVNFADRVAFVLDGKGIVRKVQFIAIVEEGDVGLLSKEERAEAPEETFLADFVLMSGELSSMLSQLIAALGGLAK